MMRYCNECGISSDLAEGGISSLQVADNVWLSECRACFVARNPWASDSFAVVGSVVKLPARNSKVFRQLPVVTQALLHAAHRIQFRLRTRLDVQPTEKALLQAGLLRAVKLAERAASAANAGKVVSI